MIMENLSAMRFAISEKIPIQVSNTVGQKNDLTLVITQTHEHFMLVNIVNRLLKSNYHSSSKHVHVRQR